MSVAEKTFPAAVVRAKGGRFELEQVSLGKPQHNEVVVRIVATGICHTDMVARDGDLPVPQPIVLGHEGAGVVEAVGDSVRKVVPGDHVVLSPLSCGLCPPCQDGAPLSCENTLALNFSGCRLDGSHAVHSHSGQELHDRFFGQSSFGGFAVAGERNVVKVRKDAPLELLGPLGCGIMTGAGAVLNSLKVTPGSTIAVFGAGAVGLSAVLAAQVAGASTIIAVDVVPARLELAKSLGATHIVNSSSDNPVQVIRELTGAGVDFSVEATGRPEVLRNAVDALRSRGHCAVLGISKPGATVALDINDLLMSSKHVHGVLGGDSIPDIFIPKLVDLYMQGRFAFDKLVKFYPFEQINEAAHDSEKGITLKPIVRIGASA